MKLFAPHHLAIVAALTFAFPVFADDKLDEAVKKDRKAIEGIWRITSATDDGEASGEADLKALLVVNGSDGAWELKANEATLVKGSSTFNPTKTPKTIDFEITEGDEKGKKFIGIYEITGDTRKMVFVPADKERPTDFTAERGSKRTLVTYERVKKQGEALGLEKK